jgi:hypothetical protein
VTVTDGKGGSASASVTVAVNTATFSIFSSAGAGGSISPLGAISVTSGGSQTFAIAANSGFTIASVTVDGNSVGAVASYTFTNVTADHTIAASFNAIPPPKTLHVAAISMTLSSNTKGKAATAAVKIVDSKGVAVSGATVSGSWSGLTSSNVSGSTGSGGVARFTSARTKATGTFTFTVNNVTASGYTYDSSKNVVSSASITTSGVVGSGAPVALAAESATNTVDLGTVTVNQSFKLALALPDGLTGKVKAKATGLPKGVRVSGSSIGGKTKQSGAFVITVQFSNKAGSAAQVYTLTVNP